MKQIAVLLAFASGIFAPLLFTSLPNAQKLLSYSLLAFILLEGANFVCRLIRTSLSISHIAANQADPVRTFPFRILVFVSFSIGMFYGATNAISFKSSLLPDSLNNAELILHGHVVGLPEKTHSAWNKEIWKFDFIPDDLELINSLELDVNNSNEYLPQKIRLSYFGDGYNSKNNSENISGGLDAWEPLPPIVAGAKLSVQVKLRRPHSLSNPGLFNYQRWLIAEGYSATGYVKMILTPDDTDKISNTLNLSNFDQHEFETIRANRPVCNSFGCRVDQIRFSLALHMSSSGVPYSGIQTALLVGDGSAISNETTSLFIETGTIHLMVISGLHIGFMAAIGFFTCRWVITLLFYKQGVNALRWSSLSAILCALLYSMIAGFSMPTIRALIMVSAFMLPRVFLIKTNPWWGLSLALCVVGLIEPRAPLQTGFWLSFGAVTLIFLSLNKTNVLDVKEESDSKRFKRILSFSSISTALHPFISLIKIQLVFLIGFAPVILWFQGQLNLVSFAANLVAVPLTSLVIVPLEFIGLCAYQISSNLGFFIWRIAGFFIGIEISLLEFLRDHLSFWLVKSSVPIWIALLSILGGFGVIGFKAYRYKVVFLMFMLPLFLPRNIFPASYVLEVRVFDVGQGTAVLVRQPGYNLLYDTGPKFSNSFDSGADILAPSLRQLGIKQIDDLVLSHPDADHIGGFVGLSESVKSQKVWLGRRPGGGEILKLEQIQSANECLNGINWTEGDVVYKFIHPSFSEIYLKKSLLEEQYKTEPNNDRSCVLSISFGGQRILLPGDISASVEKTLLDELKSDARKSKTSTALLIAPHHGSKTSSSFEFIEQLSPMNVVFSAGYLNRFGHPHPDVQNRYDQAAVTSYSTATEGMIRFTWTDFDAEPIVKTEVDRHLFWWQK